LQSFVSKLRIIVNMKRLLIIIIVVVLLIAVCIEICIPSTIQVSRVAPVRCRDVAAFSVLRNGERWARWWPASSRDSVLRYHGLDYRIGQLSYNTVHVDILSPPMDLRSRIVVIQIGNGDSSLLQWDCTVPAGMDPIRKISRYLEAGRIAKDMDTLLGHAAGYLGKMENIYGISIRESSTKDTLLVFEESHFIASPTNAEIYGLIGAVKNHILRAGGTQTGYPMVNVSGGDTGYRVRVAVPTDRHIPDKGPLHFMRLIPGNYLVTDVTGGPAMVQRAIAALQEYIRDYQRTVMAIPFQSLITDRSAEPDTARWKTRIYYPIF